MKSGRPTATATATTTEVVMQETALPRRRGGVGWQIGRSCEIARSVLSWFVRGSPASPLRKVVITMSDNFWERDYVIEHLEAYPEDREWLEQLSTRTLDELRDVVMFVRSTHKSN